MKLIIRETTVVSGGAVKVRGQIHDTNVDERKDDAEAYQLIVTGRALDLETEEGTALQEETADAEAARQAEEDAGASKASSKRTSKKK